jgi:hypothetical protein
MKIADNERDLASYRHYSFCLLSRSVPHATLWGLQVNFHAEVRGLPIMIKNER